MQDRSRSVLSELTCATGHFVSSLTEPQRAQACHRFTDEALRQDWAYVPRDRAGLTFADLTRHQRKAVHAMLTTVLRPHAYAQVTAIMALEDVLDHTEHHRLGRHNTDYWIAVFGDPGTSDPWGWRFEGHHLSLNITVIDGRITTTPCFFGANPAVVRYRDTPILAPLSQEEHLARALLAGFTPAQRRLAIVADTAPDDIRTAAAARVDATLEPRGVTMAALDSTGSHRLRALLALYLDRFRPEISPADWGSPEEISFAWEGPPEPGAGHYYRIHAANLLIEYDNTANDANHVHSVLRHPTGDFGADLLARHYRHDPHPAPASNPRKA
jgi:hypothetical protein